jgi:predicted ATPase/transcriptional regulator with XRE-family HTH domain
LEASFSGLLRALRSRARLSQEELAERSGLSVQAVGSLERGSRRAPYKRTVESLAGALGADEWELEALLSSAARARRRDKGVVLPAAFERASDLPAQVTSFVGRESAVAEILALLEQRRLVTVTGIGGVGKTRLAIVAGSRALGRYEDGARFVDLSSLTGSNEVVQKFAFALAMTVTSADVLASLVAELRPRQLLVVIDNCEHVLEAVAGTIAAVLQSCQGIDFIATSRQRLSLSGECVYRLDPLEAPAAVELFAHRAWDGDRNFKVTDANASTIADICRNLDGIPLAIEIAAARLASLGLAELQAKVCSGKTALSSGLRDNIARHETLTATMRWSYDLLDERERAVFRRLSVFAGSCSVEAARAVCAGAPVEIADIDDVLSALVDKSLLSADFQAVERRFRLLETTREYGFGMLSGCGEAVVAVERHARWVESFSQDARNPAIRADYPEWTARVAREYDNVSAALYRAIESDRDVAVAASILSNLEWYWGTIWRWSESTRLANAILARLDVDRYPEIAARLLLAKSQGLIGLERRSVVQKAIDLFSVARNDAERASSYLNLAYTCEMLGEPEEMLRAASLAWTFTIKAGIDPGAGAIGVLYFRAQALEIAGLRREARRSFNEALTLCRSTGRTFYEEACLYNLATLDAVDGHVDEALASFENLFANPNTTASAKWVYTRVAGCHILKGEVISAAAAARAALLVPEELPLGDLCALERAAHVASLSGNVSWANRMLRYVQGRFDAYGCKRNMLDLVCYQKLEALLNGASAERVIFVNGPRTRVDDRSAIPEALDLLDGMLDEVDASTSDPVRRVREGDALSPAPATRFRPGR